jgi:hypothetical protein
MTRENIQEKGVISLEDDITFPKIIDVLNDLFNFNYKGTARCEFPIGRNGSVLWFPKLNETTKKYKPNPATHGHITAECWSNVLSFDGTTITQKWIATDFLPKETTEPKIVDMGVFAKELKGDYRFIGIFQYDPENSHCYTTIYKRKSTELPFIEWRR